MDEKIDNNASSEDEKGLTLAPEFLELLDDIPGDDPCGKSLKYDLLYDKIREARREDDPRLSQGVWQTEIKRANWIEVKKMTFQALKERTKDLQLVMWHVEALIAMDGFSGLVRGLDFILEITEKFWDGIYPKIGENNDFDFRLAPFFFFTTQITEKIILVPLTAVSDDSGLSYNLADWILARHNMKIKNTTGLDLKTILKGISFTSLEFLEDIKSKVSEAKEQVQKLSDFLYEKCQNASPSFQPVFEIFDDILRTNDKNLDTKRVEIARERVRKEQEAAHAKLAEEDSSASERPEGGEATVGEAYRVLGNIASFLEEKQPQSPASTLIRIAQLLGGKTFQEVLEMDRKNSTYIMTTISDLYKMTNKREEPSEATTHVPTPEEVRERLRNKGV